MDIDKIINKIKYCLKDENVDVVIKLNQHDQFGFKILVNGFDLAKMKEFEKRNKELSLRFGFTQNIVGMDFTIKDKIYQITGFKTQNRKYPIIATEAATGQNYKFSADYVKKYLGGDKLINRAANLENLFK